MRRSSPSRASVRRLAPLFMGLALSLLTFPSAAWAATVPAPSPGPPNVPLTVAGGDVVSLSGLLLIALAVALPALVIVVAGRRGRSFAAATRRVTPLLVSADRSGDRIHGDPTAPPAEKQAEEEKRRLAA